MRSVLYSDEGASLPAVSTSGGGCLGLFNQPPSSRAHFISGTTDFWPVLPTLGVGILARCCFVYSALVILGLLSERADLVQPCVR